MGQKLNWDRLFKLKQADPEEFTKMKHSQLCHPSLFKSPEEVKKLEQAMKKYVSFDKQDDINRKAAEMFGEECEQAELDNSFESGNSTDAQSEHVDEECQSLFFSAEELDMMNDADKEIYMTKLQHDFQVIKIRLDEVIEKVKQARKEAKESIKGGQDTLAAYQDYFKRYNKVLDKALGNMGCYEDHCRMGMSEIKM